MSELLTPSQAAEQMGVTVRTVYQYLSDGNLPGAYKDDRGRWQIPADAIPDEMPFAGDDAAEEAAVEPAAEEVSPEQEAPPESEAPSADDTPPFAGAPPIEELSPEERAARRERERAAALAALYAEPEPEPEAEASLEALVEQEMQEPEEEADALYAAGAAEREADLESAYADQELDEEDLTDQAMAQEDVPDTAPEPEAMHEDVESVAYAGEEWDDENLANLEMAQEDTPDAAEEDAEQAADASTEAGDAALPDQDEEVAIVPVAGADAPAAETQIEEAPADDAPAQETPVEPRVETGASTEPDDYVMDVEPIDEESQPPDASEQAVARAVLVEGVGENLSDVDLSDMDLAKLAASDEDQPQVGDEDGETETATATAKKSGVGCPVMIAILATLLILLIAAVFIADQSLDLFGGSEDEVAAVEPGTVQRTGEEATVDEATASQPATEAPTAAEPVEPAAEIMPAAEGESLVLIPAFAGTDAALNAALRDAVTEQAAELGVGNLRAEAEPSSLNTDQLAEAVDLATRYNADTLLWGGSTGDQLVVNLLSTVNAGLPQAEAAGTDSPTRIQPIAPDSAATFAAQDASAQVDFLAGMAVAQSLLSAGAYDQAAAAIQQAVDSVGPGAPPTGLDEAFYRLGWIKQTQQNDPQAALDAYTLALQLNPDHAAALNNVGLVQDELGDKQQALFFYNRALPLLRESEQGLEEALVLNRIGALYNEIGDVQQALSFYNRALPLTLEAGAPAVEAETRRSIALIHKDLGELDIAEEEMVKVLTLAEIAGLSTVAQDQQALEEIQALRAEQTSATPIFRQRNR